MNYLSLFFVILLSSYSFIGNAQSDVLRLYDSPVAQININKTWALEQGQALIDQTIGANSTDALYQIPCVEVTLTKLQEAIPSLKAFLIDTVTVALPLANFDIKHAPQSTKLSVREVLKFCAVGLKAATGAPKDKGGDFWSIDDVFANGLKLPVRWGYALNQLANHHPIEWEHVKNQGPMVFFSIPEHGQKPDNKVLSNALKAGGEWSEFASRIVMAAKSSRSLVKSNSSLPVFLITYAAENPASAIGWTAQAGADIALKRAASKVVELSYPTMAKFFCIPSIAPFLERHPLMLYGGTGFLLVIAPNVLPDHTLNLAATLTSSLAPLLIFAVVANPYGAAIVVAVIAVAAENLPLEQVWQTIDPIEQTVNIPLLAYSMYQNRLSSTQAVAKGLAYLPEFAIETLAFSIPVQAAYKFVDHYAKIAKKILSPEYLWEHIIGRDPNP